MQARIRIKLYGMAMLMHKSNVATLGPAYMSHALADRESARINFARGIWEELERRDLINDLRKGKT